MIRESCLEEARLFIDNAHLDVLNDLLTEGDWVEQLDEEELDDLFNSGNNTVRRYMKDALNGDEEEVARALEAIGITVEYDWD